MRLTYPFRSDKRFGLKFLVIEYDSYCRKDKEHSGLKFGDCNDTDEENNRKTQ